MSGFDTLFPVLESMKNSVLQNYVIAGLQSSLIGGGPFGQVRLFEGSRRQLDSISPHSHRFDFACIVLRGRVLNRVWHASTENYGDFFQESELTYSGTVGLHGRRALGRNYWAPRDQFYDAGESYCMKADEIHSIEFTRDAVVLFFEGPSIRDWSVVLEPVVDGSVIPTYETRPYMFKRRSEESL